MPLFFLFLLAGQQPSDSSLRSRLAAWRSAHEGEMAARVTRIMTTQPAVGGAVVAGAAHSSYC